MHNIIHPPPNQTNGLVLHTTLNNPNNNTTPKPIHLNKTKRIPPNKNLPQRTVNNIYRLSNQIHNVPLHIQHTGKILDTIAIPYILVERLIYVLGIMIFHLFTKKSLKARQTTIIIRIIHLEFQIQEKIF